MIDLHAHVVLGDVLGEIPGGPTLDDDPDCPTFTVGDYTLTGVRYRGSAFMDLDVRLAAMDELGITHQVLSPNPLTFLQRAEPEVAVAYARRHNEALGALVAASGGRLSGLAQLPVQGPAAAAKELRRAVEVDGLVGACLGTDYGIGGGGLPLDDPTLDELYRTFVALDVAMFVHPVPKAVDGVRVDERYERFDLDLYLTFTVEEALAVATLVFGGVLDRHPDLRVCISHGGGALLGIIGKLRSAATRRSFAPDHLRVDGALDAALRRLWFDAHMSDPTTTSALAALVGADRLVGGTNFAGWDQPDELPAPNLVESWDRNAAELLGPRWACRAKG